MPQDHPIPGSCPEAAGAAAIAGHDDALATAVRQAAACTLCAAHLPLGPRPIFRVAPAARILINSQAPGRKAHISGIPFDDASGERLRAWLQLDPASFYDPGLVAIIPTGLCYPGVLPNGGDAPPRRECAPLWLDRFLPLLPAIRLTLLVGAHAQQRRLGPGAMTDRVRRFRAFGPALMPLPHPSWRTKVWEQRNPWFAEDLLPALRQAVHAALVP